jgi:hypothetical protein
MPLPSVEKYGAKRCSAKSKRTKEPCKNPAAYGCKTCRYHGAKRSRKAPQGVNHHQYKNAGFTKPEKAERRVKSLMFQRLEEIGWHIGMFTGTKTRGRKVGNILDLNNEDELLIAISECINCAKKTNGP